MEKLTNKQKIVLGVISALAIIVIILIIISPFLEKDNQQSAMSGGVPDISSADGQQSIPPLTSEEAPQQVPGEDIPDNEAQVPERGSEGLVLDEDKEGLYSMPESSVYTDDKQWTIDGVEAAENLSQEQRDVIQNKVADCAVAWMTANSWETEEEREARLGGCFIDYEAVKNYSPFEDIPRIADKNSIHRMWQEASLNNREIYSYVENFQETGHPAALVEVIVGRAQMKPNMNDPEGSAVYKKGAIQMIFRAEPVDGEWKIAGMWVPAP